MNEQPINQGILGDLDIKAIITKFKHIQYVVTTNFQSDFCVDKIFFFASWIRVNRLIARSILLVWILQKNIAILWIWIW